MNLAATIISIAFPFALLVCFAIVTYVKSKRYKLSHHAFTRMQERYNQKFKDQTDANEFINYLLKHKREVIKINYGGDKKTRKMIVCYNPENDLEHPIVVNSIRKQIITVYEPTPKFDTSFLKVNNEKN